MTWPDLSALLGLVLDAFAAGESNAAGLRHGREALLLLETKERGKHVGFSEDALFS